jgi:hypothetical protein
MQAGPLLSSDRCPEQARSHKEFAVDAKSCGPHEANVGANLLAIAVG